MRRSARIQKRKKSVFCCRSRLKKIGKSFAQSVRHFHSEPMKLFQEENVIFCLRNWSPSHIYFFHLGGTRIRESATAAFSVNHTWSADCLRTRARDILARKWQDWFVSVAVSETLNIWLSRPPLISGALPSYRDQTAVEDRLNETLVWKAYIAAKVAAVVAALVKGFMDGAKSLEFKLVRVKVTGTFLPCASANKILNWSTHKLIWLITLEIIT